MTVRNMAKSIIIPAGLAFCMVAVLTACSCTRSKTQAQTVPTTVQEPAGAPMPAATEMQSANIPLYEEKLQVGKQSVDSGQVRLHKVITTEHVSQPVDLKKESLQIVREPAGATAPSAESKAFQPEDIVIRLQEEQPVLQKQTVQTGVVVANKSSTTEQRTITGDVRKEDVQVERSGSSANVSAQGVQINEAAGAPQSQPPMMETNQIQTPTNPENQ